MKCETFSEFFVRQHEGVDPKLDLNPMYQGDEIILAMIEYLDHLIVSTATMLNLDDDLSSGTLE